MTKTVITVEHRGQTLVLAGYSYTTVHSQSSGAPSTSRVTWEFGSPVQFRSDEEIDWDRVPTPLDARKVQPLMTTKITPLPEGDEEFGVWLWWNEARASEPCPLCGHERGEHGMSYQGQTDPYRGACAKDFCGCEGPKI